MTQSATHNSRQPLTLEKITIREGRIELVVCLANECYRKTDPALIVACLKHYPTLAEHACKNPQGKTFAAVMNNTTTPHLLEHLIIDAQMRSLEHASSYSKAASARGTSADSVNTGPFGKDTYLMGTTEFLPEDPLRARVVVSYYDDLIGLAACKNACEFLNACLVQRN